MATWIGTGSSNPGDVKTNGNMELDNGSYPSMQLFNYAHNNVSLNFDSYYSGGWLSSDSTSNFRIYKMTDCLRISYASGVSAGSTINAWTSETSNLAICISSSGWVTVGGS